MGLDKKKPFRSSCSSQFSQFTFVFDLHIFSLSFLSSREINHPSAAAAVGWLHTEITSSLFLSLSAGVLMFKKG